MRPGTEESARTRAAGQHAAMASFIILYFQHCASLFSNICPGPHFLVFSVVFAAAFARLTCSSPPPHR